MSIVHDYRSIASRLRRDDFYVPTKVESVKPPLYLMCFDCNAGIGPNEPRIIDSYGGIHVRCPYCQNLNIVL